MKTSERLSKEQIKTLINGLTDDGKQRDALYVSISFFMGLRVSDVLKMTWEDLVTNGKVNSVVYIKEKKTGKTREIKVNETLKKHITKSYEGQTGFVFCNIRTGKQLTTRNFNLKLKEWNFDYLKNTTVHFSTHSFRKSFGYAIWDAKGRTNEQLVLLMDIFNHTSLDMTKKYLGITRDEKFNAYDSLDF